MRVNKTLGTSDLRDYIWKRRPSEIRGYHRTLYLTTEKGDYLRVDYNIKERRVRLYIEDSDEGGNPYYSVIVAGKIVVERNATTGRVAQLFDKISKRSDIFSTITNNEVLKIINRNYGIAGSVLEAEKDDKEILKKEADRKREIELTKRKYFSDESYSPYIVKTEEKKSSKIDFIDFVDLFIGSLICILLYIYSHNYIIVGMLSAFIGILTGFLDIFYRKRLPYLLKVILFITIGLVLYIYGYYIF